MARCVYENQTYDYAMADFIDGEWFKVKFHEIGVRKILLKLKETNIDLGLAVYDAEDENSRCFGVAERLHDELVLNITVEADIYYYIYVKNKNNRYGDYLLEIQNHSLDDLVWKVHEENIDFEVEKKSTDNDWYAYNKNGWITTLGFNGKSSGDRNPGHLGNDFSKESGSEVKAIYKGTIVSAKYAKWNGNVVHLKHEINGIVFYSFYAHLNEILIKKGNVETGEIIGIMGGTGNKGVGFKDHLHLGIFTGNPPASGDTQGYYRENGKKNYFDEYDGNGFKDFSGRRFFDPVKVIETKGKLIVDKYSSFETTER